MAHRLGSDSIIVESAGLAAMTGYPIDPMAGLVLAEHGLTDTSHTARQITPELIGAADILLAMERRHVSAIRALVPRARGKTFLLGRWQGDCEIADPYGQSRPVFEQAYQRIDAAVTSWLSHI